LTSVRYQIPRTEPRTEPSVHTSAAIPTAGFIPKLILVQLRISNFSVLAPAGPPQKSRQQQQSKLIIFIFRQSERSNDVNNMINNNSNNNNTNNNLFFAFGEYSFAKISIKIHGATVRLE